MTMVMMKMVIVMTEDDNGDNEGGDNYDCR